ncbi:MAG: signal peptidase II [bacterium]|nr:signal peptidase II [bacterium]
MKSFSIKFFIIAGIIVIFDQITKLAIITYAQSQEGLGSRMLSSWFGFIDIVYTTNPGAAFGIFPDQRILFIIISVIAIAGILFYTIKYQSQISQWSKIGLAFILGGAVGNLIDRIFRIEVVDFIDVHFRNYHWPAFNLADTAICVGVGIIIIELMTKTRSQKTGARSQNSAENN